jgi:hypothetical protein
LEKQKAERLGVEVQHQAGNDRALSQAIASDFREARQQLKPTEQKGFAWGIREAIWGPPKAEKGNTAVDIPMRSKEEMAESPQETLVKNKDGRG